MSQLIGQLPRRSSLRWILVQGTVLHAQRLLILSEDVRLQAGTDCFGSLLPPAKKPSRIS